MRRNFSVLCLCLAWLCANGMSSPTAPVMTCGQLLVNFSHHLPAAEALAKADDTHSLCPICLALQHAEEDARHHPVPPDDTSQPKLQLACHFIPAPMISAVMALPQPDARRKAAVRTEPVPMQPPRSLG